jgi:hypothetical protein
MTKLRCKRVAHSPDFPDLTICDFDLFSHLNDKLAGFHPDGYTDLLRRMQGILTVIDRTNVKNAFGHWIERCQGVAANKREYYPE